MHLYRPFFELVADGSKKVEVRVRYPKLRDLEAGDRIRFLCESDTVLTQVKRVACYASFEEMLDAEGVERVNPTSSRERILAGCRRVYGPEKEALGVLAIEIELVGEA